MNPDKESPYSPPTDKRIPRRIPVKAASTGSSVFWMMGATLIGSALATAILSYTHDQNRNRSAAFIGCLNNLRGIELALLSYHSDHGSFPPATLQSPNGRPAHSWRVLILPYLDQQALYDQYRFDEPWNGPSNIQLQDKMPNVYR